VGAGLIPQKNRPLAKLQSGLLGRVAAMDTLAAQRVQQAQLLRRTRL